LNGEDIMLELCEKTQIDTVHIHSRSLFMMEEARSKNDKRHEHSEAIK
jgi:hypothetical protein